MLESLPQDGRNTLAQQREDDALVRAVGPVDREAVQRQGNVPRPGVRLVETLQDRHLGHSIQRHIGRHDLDGNVAVELVVSTQPHGAVRAVAEFVNDAVSLRAQAVVYVYRVMAAFLVLVQILYLVLLAVVVGPVRGGCRRKRNVIIRELYSRMHHVDSVQLALHRYIHVCRETREEAIRFFEARRLFHSVSLGVGANTTKRTSGTGRHSGSTGATTFPQRFLSVKKTVCS